MLIEGNLIVFIAVTLGVGGAAAWLTGRGVALSWAPLWLNILYAFPLGFMVRFLHYALFGGRLLYLPYLAVDFAVVAIVAVLGYRRTRTSQMATQYGWVYEARGLLFWRRRG